MDVAWLYEDGGTWGWGVRAAGVGPIAPGVHPVPSVVSPSTKSEEVEAVTSSPGGESELLGGAE